MTCKTFCQYAKDVGMIEYSCYNECLYSLKEMTMKFNKPTLVTLTAPTCSGKSVLLNQLCVQHCRRIVSTTTRAPRQGEREGVDYYFISEDESRRLEENGEFAELVTFRGIRYGVTKREMFTAMNGEKPPVVVLEPQGLDIYEKLCHDNDWGIFRVYVQTQESVRLERLGRRTQYDIEQIIARVGTPIQGIDKLIATHTDRVLSITSEERCWHSKRLWDVNVPGDNLQKAVQMIAEGVELRNRSLTRR